MRRILPKARGVYILARMALTREDAWSLLCEWTPGAALRRHALAVEHVLRAAATRYGPGESAAPAWGLAGLLHDADYEQWPAEHPRRIVAWLQARGEPELAHAISAHYTKWGVPHESPLDRALLACDELTGFVGACARVRPGGLRELEPKSVLKRLKDKGFAAKVERFEIEEGVRLLGVPLAEHVEFVIGALRPHAAELLLDGAPAARG
jgi:predicted hydrolase (HD superfamily)